MHRNGSLSHPNLISKTNTSSNLLALSVHRLVFLLADEKTEKVSLWLEAELGFKAWFLDSSPVSPWIISFLHHPRQTLNLLMTHFWLGPDCRHSILESHGKCLTGAHYQPDPGDAGGGGSWDPGLKDIVERHRGGVLEGSVIRQGHRAAGQQPLWFRAMAPLHTHRWQSP